MPSYTHGRTDDRQQSSSAKRTRADRRRRSRRPAIDQALVGELSALSAHASIRVCDVSAGPDVRLSALLGQLSVDVRMTSSRACSRRVRSSIASGGRHGLLLGAIVGIEPVDCLR